MTETAPGITDEFRAITLSDRELLLHILQHVEHQDALIADMHAELEAARPLIERATHSRLLRLATGVGVMSWPTGDHA